jgi:ADP-L-glycero-D-manno-heptose 6-epimerase
VKANYQAIDVAPKITFIDMPMELRNQYQYYTQADMGKLKKALPKFKFMKLEDAVGDYVKGHLSQPEQYLS